MIVCDEKWSDKNSEQCPRFMKRIQKRVCGTGLTAASQFKVVLIRVNIFKDEKFVILEWKLDREGLLRLSRGFFS